MRTLKAKKEDLTIFSPDFYTRHFLGFQIIKKIQGDKLCRILDIGGKMGILGKLIKKENLPYNLTVIDTLPDDKRNPTICDQYIKRDFLKSNFKDKEFDFVVSFDVLEHINDKDIFVEKTLGAGRTVVLTAPFASPEVIEAEKLASNFFLKYTGKKHPWLKEHLKAKLPEKRWMESFLKRRRCFSRSFGSNNLSNWLLFILPNFIPTFFSVELSKIYAINRFYNQNFAKIGDFDPPFYREIYVISRDKSRVINLLRIKDIISFEQNLTKKLVFQRMVFDFMNDELKGKIGEISQREKQIDKLTKGMTNKLEQKEKVLKSKEEIIKQKIEEVDRLNFHINNLQGILNNITSAKTFKIWQAFVKVRNRVKENPLVISKGLKILITEGPKGIKDKLMSVQRKEQKIADINQQYQIWLKKHTPTEEELEKQRKLSKKFKYQPKISIITPVCGPDEKWLRACIGSVLNQTYDNWELCLADDASTKPYVRKVLEEYRKKDKRIKVVYRKKNGHICRASNSALKLATGEFIALLDHDDEIAPHALYEAAKLLNKHKDADFIYSDEDKLELDETRVEPFFKPDWSPDMFLSTNYLCHLSVIRKKLVDKVGGFRLGYEGSQDYDLFLRVTEKTDKIYHIPDVLYSWRKVPGSTAAVYEVKEYANRASLKALGDAIKRRRLEATVENGLVPGTFRVKYKIVGNPLVSIIIPTKNKVRYLKKCVESVLTKTGYQNYEILIVDTGSKEKETLNYYKKLKSNSKIRFLKWRKPFNFAAVNNFAVKKVKGKYVLLLNNDTEVVSSEWLSAMLEHIQRKEIGAVGAKLLYPDNTIQHIGLVLGKDIGATHYGIHYKDLTSMTFPFLNAKDIIRNVSAVTGACLLIKKSKYLKLGGLDENFPVDYNDVDFCLSLLKKGFVNVYTPFSILKHYESVSAGSPSREEKERTWRRVLAAKKQFIEKWGGIGEKDKYFNKNIFWVDKDLIALKNLFLTSRPAKKNILIISHLYWPAVGGAERVFQKIAEGLARKGYKVDVLTSNVTSTELYYKKDAETYPVSHEVKNGVEIIRENVNNPVFRFLKPIWVLVRRQPSLLNTIGPLVFGPHFFNSFREVFKRDYHYIIAGPVPTSAGFYGLLFKKIKRAQLIIIPCMHIRDKLHTAVVSINLLKKADYIFALTQAETEFLVKKGIDKSKITVIGVGADNFILKHPVVKTTRLKDYVLYLGQEGGHKNIPLLIEAMKKIWEGGKKTKLVIAGARSQFSLVIDDIIKNLPKKFQNKIIRLNNISEKKKIELLDNCLVVVNPSSYESFGIVFIEAWARKKPVIGADVPATNKLIEHEKNGLLFEDKSVDDLEKKVLRIIRSKRLAQTLALNGYRKVKEEYNWEKIMGEIKKAIREE